MENELKDIEYITKLDLKEPGLFVVKLKGITTRDKFDEIGKLLMENKLKLYVWDNFCPDCWGGLAFAIAESEDDAKVLISKKYGYIDGECVDTVGWGTMSVHELNKKVTYSITGGCQVVSATKE